MSSLYDVDFSNGNFNSAVNHLLSFPEDINKLFGLSDRETKRLHNPPVDILETPKEYLFQFDVPGLCKPDLQVTIEDGNILVIRSSGKRKHAEMEEECKYLRLERKASSKLSRKFRLPEDCNLLAVSAKCENGVLAVAVQKLQPKQKGKTVEVTVN